VERAPALLLASSAPLATESVLLADLPKFDPDSDNVTETLSGETPVMVGPFANVVRKLMGEDSSSRRLRQVLRAAGQPVPVVDIPGNRPGRSTNTIAQTKVRARICLRSGIT
jgi:hypothetical protein